MITPTNPLEALDNLIVIGMLNTSNCGPGSIVMKADQKTRSVLSALKSHHVQTLRSDACFNCWTPQDLERIKQQRAFEKKQMENLSQMMRRWELEDFCLGAKMNGRL